VFFLADSPLWSEITVYYCQHDATVVQPSDVFWQRAGIENAEQGPTRAPRDPEFRSASRQRRTAHAPV